MIKPLNTLKYFLKENKTRKDKSIEIKQNGDNISTKISFISNEADIHFLTFNNQMKLN